jgi:predicted membrane protein
MYKALVLKEVRENAWMAAVALVAYAFLLLTLMGFDLWTMRWYPVQRIPFEDVRFLIWSIPISAIFGILLGIRQSWWESVRGTSVFLLHRPIARRAVFATKLATGAVLFLSATGLPLLVYALWAAWPGTHASPFYWSMTGTCWLYWLAMTVVYAAAFLTGLREARWFGSRLFPLVGVALPLVVVADTPWTAGLFVAITADVLLVCSILWVGVDREYP